MSKYVNGINYGWAVITLKFPFGDVEPQSIDYGDELEKEVTYGRGNLPRGVGEGNYKATCKLNFLLDDWEQIENHCKSRGVSLYGLQIPSVVVAYANPGDRPRVDEITKVSFSKVDNKAAQGDKSLGVDVECIVAGMVIRNGVKPV